MAQPEATAANGNAPPLAIGTRLSLSVMMFLEFAVWGAWASVLGNRLGAMGLSDWIGSMYGTMALGTIVAPLFVGQIADRYFSSEKLMAILHLIGAGFLYWLATIPPVVDRDPAVLAATGWKLYGIALAYALIYSPTLALSNSIAFTHVPDGNRDFPGIRVLGTIGWIASGMTLGMVLSTWFGDSKVSNAPFLLAAGLSLVLGIFSLFLPHTPPKGKAGDALPFLRAVRLLKEPSFAVFFGVSCVITIVLAFYYNFTGLYLAQQMGVKDTASTMTIGQWSEMLLLPFLPFFLSRFGMKWVLALGMLAWGVRYGIFALGGNYAVGALYWPVILCLTLHGVCYDFFFAAGFIHVDNESPSDIRGSAQALFVFLTYGLGMWLGSELSGVIFSRTTHDVPAESQTLITTVKDWYYGKGWVTYEIVDTTGSTAKVTDWVTFWSIPSIGVLLALAVFVIFFHMRPKGRSSAVSGRDSPFEVSGEAGVSPVTGD
jgi:nucleoside transporter